MAKTRDTIINGITYHEELRPDNVWLLVSLWNGHKKLNIYPFNYSTLARVRRTKLTTKLATN